MRGAKPAQREYCAVEERVRAAFAIASFDREVGGLSYSSSPFGRIGPSWTQGPMLYRSLASRKRCATSGDAGAADKGTQGAGETKGAPGETKDADAGPRGAPASRRPDDLTHAPGPSSSRPSGRACVKMRPRGQRGGGGD